MSIAAIIPARGGSKGLPRKNVLPFCGKPLIVWTIEAALSCPQLAAVVVSTDDDEIAQTATSAGAEVVWRPANLAMDASPIEDVIVHALDALAAAGRTFEHLLLLQPTSPLRTSAHIQGCIDAYFSAKASSAMSVCPPEHHPYKALREENGQLVPLFERHHLSAPRQNLPRVFRQNGAIYLAHAEAYRRERSFYIPPVAFYEMPLSASVDIDTALDFTIAKLLQDMDASPP